METRCQAWHYCDIDGRQATFLCPNGTQFSQAVFVCDWWFNVRCELSPALYAINSRLYGTPREDPTRPHRLITKELLQNIFVWTRVLHVLAVSCTCVRTGKRHEVQSAETAILQIRIWRNWSFSRLSKKQYKLRVSVNNTTKDWVSVGEDG